MEIPSLMTHASVPADHRAKLGITDNLIRLSVGVEDIEDLLADLDKGLRAIHVWNLKIYLYYLFIFNKYIK